MLREYRFYVPKQRDSDRSFHPMSEWRWLEAELCRLFGGFTRAGDRKGAWVPPGRVNPIEDYNATYYVAVERPDELRQLLGEVAVRFDQQCVYIALVSENVEIIPPCETTPDQSVSSVS
jgi:hypothetical protein